MRKGIKQYRKTDLMNVNIEYNGENFSFNLFNESRISEETLTEELKNQPSYYGFLILLQKKLLTQFETLKLERKKIRGKLLIMAKGRTINGRPMNDEMCKAFVESHPKFIRISERCIKAKDDADTLYSAVKAFEQRKDLMQTISSNERRFNH